MLCLRFETGFMPTEKIDKWSRPF